MSSRELLEKRRITDDNDIESAATSYDNIILIDVRTQPERDISMIDGAVSLKQFEHEIAPSLAQKKDDRQTLVVTYCTIGYRSAIEARRLRDKYHLQDRIYHLDGIVAYTHALAELEDDQQQTTEKSEIVHPEGLGNEGAPARTVKGAKKVHTFGFVWNVAHDNFEATHYSLPILLVRLAQVGGTVVIRKCQRLWFLLLNVMK